MDKRNTGFTLIEIVMSILILSIMTLVSFFCFDAVVQAWHAGMEMSDSMSQADYVMDQTVAALRSAYYPDAGKQLDEYGFQLYDDGEDSAAHDSISWVKIGPSLVGEDCGFAESPHRVSLFVNEEGADDERGLAVKAWRVDLHTDEFDPEQDVRSIVISPRVIGLNCRVLDKTNPMKDNDFNWQDEWKYSNCIPKTVELTLYMQPNEDGQDPIEVRRIVDIPLWDLSQNPRKLEGGAAGGGRRTQTKRPPTDSGGAVEPPVGPGGLQ